MADLSQALARVDEIIEREPDGNLAYEEMKQIYDSDESTHENVEVMWRLCKATFLKSNTLDKKNPTKKKLLLEARSYGIKAYALDEDNYEALKWEAICVGSMTDFLGIKDKIEQGFIFKLHLDKAIAKDRKDFILLHMRGRFAFSCAILSWIERKVCTALFARPPDGTIEEALSYFLQAEEACHFVWAENLAYIAKCYVIQRLKEPAMKYVEKIDSIEKKDDAILELLKEIKKDLAKCK